MQARHTSSLHSYITARFALYTRRAQSLAGTGLLNLLNHFQIRLPNSAIAASACTAQHASQRVREIWNEIVAVAPSPWHPALRLAAELGDLAKKNPIPYRYKKLELVP